MSSPSEKQPSNVGATTDVLAESGSTSLASQHAVNEKRLLLKIDWRLLPCVSVLYLLSFLDRSNVGNARVEGLVADIHMTTNQYLTGLTLFFVGYILFEVPWNIILKRTTPKIWLPTITAIWGVVATLLGIVQNLSGFYAARFFLGVAEGGLFPGVVFYLSMWYKRRERQFRVAMFFSAASLAGAFGGVLAYGIAFMDGVAGLNGWRWIFILEGIFTFLVGILAFWFVCNYPDTANFLSENEKAFVIQRLKEDSDATNNEGFTWRNVASALGDVKCWLYCAAYHTISLPLYTLSLFLPTIIADLGYSAAKAQLLTVPPYALATILTVIVAFVSEKINRRAPFMAGTAALAAIGYIILLSNRGIKTVSSTDLSTGEPITVQAYTHPAISYVGVFFATAGIYPSAGLTLSLPAVNVSGQTKRAVACGMQIMIGNLGAVIGTQLYRSEQAPRYPLGHGFCLGYLVAHAVVAATIWWVLSNENKRRDALLANETNEKDTSPGEHIWKGDDDVRWRFTT